MDKEQIIQLIKNEISITEETTRKIIREELSSLIGIDRYLFQKNIQIFDGRNIQTGRTNGTKIGTEGGATGQKIGFFNKTPVTQGAAISDPTGGVTADDVARDRITKILDRLQAIGIITT